ncbi:tyrosine-protein phosphatase non-receptor type 61F isoform X1 [Anopheles gambiae]|uniref:protein-tyrosine-phosphatase n=2 Tax=gambiae species complex TaxID=44542 RepID=A0ABK8FFU9_ANOGA|nr:tyrosine-protein phosphatase non-receptor type 61F isoform X1 [Anopheles coluzzii]XP_061497951.1 tyrosine-protein phosphatase non-receptor type 61F isoform X1 [Anopheles gambiae]
MSSGNSTTNNDVSSSGGVGGSGGSSGSSIEAEYNEIVSRRGWPMVFQDIRERSDIQARAKKFSTDESKKLENRRLNRYRDVLPYDHSRVALKRGEGDYINANLVKMERAGRKYILCQGPLPHTVGHFWMMVWEHDSRAILMLNKLIEQTTVKCHQYWPAKIGEKHRLELTGVQLSVVHLKCVEYKNFCKRTFRLTDMESGKSREVIQFHYTTWPDFGIPSSPVAFLQFLKEVRDSGTLDRDVGPPIIHCSAGIGRSGTFCLVDCCLVLVDKEGEDRVSVQDVLLELRQYRMGLIQTPDQLYFSYQAIIEGMKRMNNSSFEEFEELTVVASSSQQNSDQEDNEDTPPPLPPPRTHSLTSKPLPVIPTSESVHEDFLLGGSNGGDRDKVNNLVNLEKSKQFEMGDENHHHHHHNNHHHKRSDGSNNHHNNHHHHPYSNRPLPPIVRDSSLYKVNEMDSDGGGGGGGGVGSSGSDGSDSNAMSSEDELIEENDSDIGEEEEEEDDDEAELEEKNRGTIGRDVPSDNSDNIKSSLLDESSSSTTTATTTTATGGASSTTASSGTSTGLSTSTSVSTSSSTTASAIGSNNSTLESKRGDSKAGEEAFNANSSLPPLPNGALDDGDDAISSPERELSPGAELRRRKRIERQSAMEEKIREIKRKRKEVESKGSPKKRRLLLFSLAAGVCFSVLCVYLYTKQM